MKPQPPASLLLRNQTWAVVDAPDWEIAPAGKRCGICGVNPATAVRHGPRNGVHQRCDDHLGKYEWTQDGRVLRWRADPPFDNDRERARVHALRAGAR